MTSCSAWACSRRCAGEQGAALRHRHAHREQACRSHARMGACPARHPPPRAGRLLRDCAAADGADRAGRAGVWPHLPDEGTPGAVSSRARPALRLIGSTGSATLWQAADPPPVPAACAPSQDVGLPPTLRCFMYAIEASLRAQPRPDLQFARRLFDEVAEQGLARAPVQKAELGKLLVQAVRECVRCATPRRRHLHAAGWRRAAQHVRAWRADPPAHLPCSLGSAASSSSKMHRC